MAVSQTCRDSIVASTPSSRFSVNGQEVIDTETGLIWQKCSLGKTGSGCDIGSATLLNQEGALQAEAWVTGKAWRLPNIKELRSIVEEKCADPSINLTIFPNTARSDFWSATPNRVNSQNFQFVNFEVGDSKINYSSSNKLVRLVRAGK